MAVVSDALVAVQQRQVGVKVGRIVGRMEGDRTNAKDLERFGLVIDSQLPFAALYLQVTMVDAA